MTLSACASAPGKAILFGEHAVVYGSTAIASALGLRTYIALQLPDLPDPCNGSGNDNDPVINPAAAPADDLVLAFKDWGHVFHLELGTLPWRAARQMWSASLSKDTRQPPDAAALSVAKDTILSAIEKAVVAQIPQKQGTDLLLSAASVLIYVIVAFFSEENRFQSVLKRRGTWSLTVISTLPCGAGLGSSASFSVAVAAAMLAIDVDISSNSFKDDNTWRAAVNSWASLAESCFHGRMSGIDSATATYGGNIVFQRPQTQVSASHKAEAVAADLKTDDHATDDHATADIDIGANDGFVRKEREISVGSTIAETQNSSDGARIERLKNSAIRIMIIDTGIPKKTVAQVQHVAELYESLPDITSSIVNTVDLISKQARNLLLNEPKNYIARLGELSTINQNMLEALGVSHPRIREIIEIVASKNIGWAKITGAGGGGCLLVLLDPNATENQIRSVIQKLEELNAKTFTTDIGVPGVSAVAFCDNRILVENGIKCDKHLSYSAADSQYASIERSKALELLPTLLDQ